MITVDDLAKELNLTPAAIRYRKSMLDLELEPITPKGKIFNFTEEDKYRISNYKGHIRKRIDKETLFKVVELFLMLDNNSVTKISELSGITASRVSYILTEYLKNERCITVESKINKK